MGNSEKTPIIFNPDLWPKEGWPEGRGLEYHIRHQTKRGKAYPPPDEFWTVALPKLKKKIDPFKQHSWWIDLGTFHPNLKKWKLTGLGNLPRTILLPGEKPFTGSVKLAYILGKLAFECPEPQIYDPSTFTEVDDHPTSLDL